MENNKKIEELINKLKNSNYAELLDKVILGDIENSFNNYLENYKRLESEDKILTIGIVGQVKAGKSSFLNALFFNSSDILPKAATPMTAALTKIRYSENISAKVHFFSKSDFETIENGAKDCKKTMIRERDKLNEELKKKGKPETKLTDAQLLGMVELSDSVKSFYEIFENFKKNEGELRNKLSNSEESDNFEILEGIDSIDALKNRLEDYVGVNGKYMPIVKYIEIFLNIEAIKDFDIVDTPGLNDPVLSRGQLTRNFLGKCDVVFLLSASSQFFDSQDISLFSEQIPQEGISRVIVIGSKFDNGLIGESQKYNNDIKTAQVGVKNVLNEQFKARIKDSQRQNIRDMFENAFPPNYVSSSCYDIYKHYGNLSKNEERIKNNIIRAFPHFLDDAEKFKELSGIEIFNSDIIPKIVSEKKKIFEERSNNAYLGFMDKFTSSIEELDKSVKDKQEKLSNGDIKSLEDKVKSTLNNLEKLKHNINDCYDEKTHEVKSKFNDLLTEINDIIDMNSEVKKREKTEDYTVMVEKDGILSGIGRFFGGIFGTDWGYRQETRTRNISYAATQDVIEQVLKMTNEIKKIINNTCKNIFDINDFCQNIANKILEVFEESLSDVDFDYNAIILPLKKVLRSLSISSVKLDKDYTNIIIESVSDKEETSVETMRKAMRKTTLDIIKDIEKIVDSQSSEITEKLDEQANNLIKDISSSIESDAEELKKQLENKKEYEELYKQAVLGIEEIKNNI
ncbi:dynamin family protein [Brachyspira aalborgi]|uniref:Dynamin N-terminal domain-containing protein n=1 Tax=Brachyspira aalborgi TaxID=29522 RepID=A0A5C8EHR6_9SPIR|nr:dynamin family protein [Brachyspira aalborgi]TXJ36511.1 hypothetical protein EPJ81_09175 [Brachyspira aalborgi]